MFTIFDHLTNFDQLQKTKKAQTHNNWLLISKRALQKMHTFCPSYMC